MSSLWPCDWTDCQLPAVQQAGNCLLCNRHLCRLHLQEPWHACPNPESNWSEYSAQYAAAEAQRLNELYQRINSVNLCARASQVRDGANVPCTIDLSPKSLSVMMGGQNCHAEIKFEDGVVWLARLRLSSAISPPPEVQEDVLQSEAATLQFLERHTRIPSPRVFDWACESDPTNTVGVGYILMEKMAGTPLDWQSATAVQKEKIVRQLAEIMLEIERHPFDQLGSLVATESQIQVKGLANHSTFRSGDGGRPLGPFRSSQDAFRALVEAHLQMIVAGEIGSTAENALNVFLAHRFRLEVLDKVSEQAPAVEQFFLKHADDKGDHILVNADFEIVGIIDWEWCSTASKEEAFSSPCMMWPVAAFYDGSNELAEEELLLARVFRESGREDLARCVLDGRKVQRLLFALGPSETVEEGKRTFASLFMGLKQAFDGQGFEMDQDVEDGWEAWKAKALEDWKHESMLKAVLSK
ncbi:hypothetical protein ACQKWADRAFT_304818 [Trichoderma austrokoningii]